MRREPVRVCHHRSDNNTTATHHTTIAGHLYYNGYTVESQMGQDRFGSDRRTLNSSMADRIAIPASTSATTFGGSALDNKAMLPKNEFVNPLTVVKNQFDDNNPFGNTPFDNATAAAFIMQLDAKQRGSEQFPPIPTPRTSNVISTDSSERELHRFWNTDKDHIQCVDNTDSAMLCHRDINLNESTKSSQNRGDGFANTGYPQNISSVSHPQEQQSMSIHRQAISIPCVAGSSVTPNCSRYPQTTSANNPQNSNQANQPNIALPHGFNNTLPNIMDTSLLPNQRISTDVQRTSPNTVGATSPFVNQISDTSCFSSGGSSSSGDDSWSPQLADAFLAANPPSGGQWAPMAATQTGAASATQNGDHAATSSHTSSSISPAGDHFDVKFLNRQSRQFLQAEHPHLVEPSSCIGNYSQLAYKPQQTLDTSHVDDHYRNLHIAGWYYGPMTTGEAKALLRPHPVGTFLLRDSSNPQYIFALSFKTRRGSTSIRILYENGKFRMDAGTGIDKEHSFDCIMQLVENYVIKTSRSPSVSHTSMSRQNSNLSSGASSSDNSGNQGSGNQGSGNQGQQCVLLESNGRMDTPLQLSRGCVKAPSSLKHLSRLAINKTVPKENRDRLLLFFEPSIENYMQEYPFSV